MHSTKTQQQNAEKKNFNLQLLSSTFVDWDFPSFLSSSQNKGNEIWYLMRIMVQFSWFSLWMCYMELFGFKC
jgi:hypothetical protein